MNWWNQLTPEQMRLVVLALGGVVFALVWLWGIRARIRDGLAERRRRRAAALAEPTAEGLAADADAQPLGDLAGVAARDPFAHQRLVDVEIRPIRREPEPSPPSGADALPLRPASDSVPPPAEVAAARAEPAPAPQQAPIPPLRLRPAANAGAAAEESRPRPAEPMHVILTVMADPGARFTGMEILMAAHELGLKFSTQGVFDGYPSGEVKGKPVFSIANVVEPGAFPPDRIQALQTPGLLLFMRLPGALAPLAALEMMLSHARRLAARLGGTLCDERRNRLGPEAIGRLRAQVVEYQRKSRLPEFS